MQKFPGVRPDPEAFIEALDPLQPRLYSISSSPKANPGRVSLTVDAVRYEVDKRTRLGVASTFLADRVAPGDKVRVYVQKAPDFALPADPAKPIIMVGPAPASRRSAPFCTNGRRSTAPGRNWLFFGHQRSAYDFFYEDEFAAMRPRAAHAAVARLVARHDGSSTSRTACARSATTSGPGSMMARTFMSAATRSAWPRMSRLALVDIVAQHGGRSPTDAVRLLGELKANDRYQTDVY